MKSASSARAGAARILGIMVVASLLSGLLSSRAISAQPEAPASAAPTFASEEAWREFMAQVPMPLKGCFTATYPNITWQEVPCRTPPPVPYPPARGPRSDTVGNGTDYSAQVTLLISSALGSFEDVAGVTRENGTYGGPNAFSLQLNTSFFSTSACSGALSPSNCLGWQQFVYSNVSCPNCAFMQYWLINYNATCPANWLSYGADCYTNSNSVSVPAQTIANLRDLSVRGEAVLGGNDTLIMSTSGHLYTVTAADSVLYLALHWNVAEFNVFGDCCGSQANFNDGSTIVVRTRVSDGSTQAPSCLETGFTGETNNLTFVKSRVAAPSGTSTETAFTESNLIPIGQGQECYAK